MLPRLCVVVLAALVHRVSSAGYCSHVTFNTNSSYMQFTKEPVPLEYGYEDNFKSIHCCVKGYRSIEWFKDGVAYPWSAGEANMVLYPEEANQTLYTRKASRADSGSYTCRLTNETHIDSHTIELKILEKPTDTPKTMYISKDKWLEEGSQLRLYCEALIGRSYLADAKRDLRWLKVWPNGTLGDLLTSQQEIKTAREDIPDVVGSYLVVPRVSAQDYGTYACVLYSNNAEFKELVTVHYKHGSASDGYLEWDEVTHETIPWKTLLLSAIGVSVLLISITVIHRRYTPRILLAARRTASYNNGASEKEFDVLVCWTSVDAELVRGALLPTMTIKYNYRAHALQLPTDPNCWYAEIEKELPRCRSVVVVVSPLQYTSAQLITALKHFHALTVPPVVVLLQDLPNLKREAKECGERFVSLVRGTRLVAWRHVHERAFWVALRLALPPPAHTHKGAEAEVEESKNSRSGSLTALV